MTGKELQAIRKRAKITQIQLSELMGVSLQTISNYESATELPAGKSDYIINFYKNAAENKKGNESLVGNYAEKENPENRILLDILNEMKDLRKDFEEMKDDRENEKKQNDVLRKQLQLAINVIKSLDRDLSDREKSTGTKQDFGKIK